jgi:arylsulfate sulfotransferase
VIELDYHTGKMLNKIDLAEILNPNRGVIVPKNHIDYGLNDWCHINGVDYDPTDAGIIVSCRHSGIIKVNEKTKELTWILSPNKGFEKSGRLGDGPDISHKVLSAIDSNNQKFDSKIQAGSISNTSFKWPTKNHNVKVYPNHIIAVYDNAGDVYDRDIYSTKFSNASLYKIDENKKTVQQLWIENLGFQSSSGSSVLYYPDEGEVVVYSSSVQDKDQKGLSYGRLTRYDFDTHKVLFSAMVVRGGEAYYYRNEDFEFYPKDRALK